MMADTDFPSARPRRYADPFVIAATTGTPETSTVTSAMTAPSWTDVIVPLN